MSVKVFVGNLPHDVRQEEIQDLFAKYGNVKSVSLKDQGRTPFAFVEYETEQEVEDAIRGLDGHEIGRNRIRVEKSNSTQRRSNNDGRAGQFDPPRHSEYKVEVTHLPYHCSWQDLKDYMKKEGEVGYCTVRNDVGYVEFLHYDDMKKAIKYLDDTKLESGRESSYIRIHSLYHSRSRHSTRDSRDFKESRSRSRSNSRSASKNSNANRSKSASPEKKDSRSPSPEK